MTTCNTARSGYDGKAMKGNALIARVTQWQIEETVNESAWGDSSTEGYTARLGGRLDLTGTIEGKYDSVSKIYPVCRPRDCMNLALWVTSSAGDYWYIPAMIRTFSFLVNIDTGEVIGWTVTFGANGKYYYPGEASIPSVSLPS